jgi:hypothetical protein
MAEENTVLTVDGPEKATAEPAKPKQTEEQKVSFEKAMETFGQIASGRKKPKEKVEEPAKTVEKDKKSSEQEKPKEDANKLNEKTQEEGDKGKAEETVHTPKPRSREKTTQRNPPLDERVLAEIAADAGARAGAATISHLEKEEKARNQRRAENDDDFKPPKEYTEQYAAFKVMAKAKPDKYGGLVDDFKRFVKEEEDYIKQWKRDHPGEPWNGEADEHNDFYQKATPTYEDADLRRAEINLELGETKKEIRREVLEEVTPKLKELDDLKRNEILRELQPAIATAEKAAMGSILKAIDPAYEKFTEPAELVKLKDEDPMGFDITIQVASDALPFVSEVTRLWKSKGAVKAEENNPLHRYIHDYASKMMELISALPAEEQLRDGKKFSTWNNFSKLSPAEQEKHWTITDQDLIERKMLDAQEIARERFANEDKKLTSWAKRKGMTNGSANNSALKPADDKNKEEPKPAPAKENSGSPSVGSRTQVGSGGQPAPSSKPAWVDQFGSILSGRKL